MSLTMYDASVPVFVRMFGNLATMLKKAEEDATKRGIEPTVLLQARLAPDMHPLTRQVQIASDAAKGGVGRLAGVEVPSFPDVETSFAELQDRIGKTLGFVQSVDAARFEGSESRQVTLKLPSRELSFTGQAFLFHVTLPNFYFHVTTAYDILRHNGVALGKMDFLGGL